MKAKIKFIFFSLAIISQFVFLFPYHAQAATTCSYYIQFNASPTTNIQNGQSIDVSGYVNIRELDSDGNCFVPFGMNGGNLNQFGVKVYISNGNGINTVVHHQQFTFQKGNKGPYQYSGKIQLPNESFAQTSGSLSQRISLRAAVINSPSTLQNSWWTSSTYSSVEESSDIILQVVRGSEQIKVSIQPQKSSYQIGDTISIGINPFPQDAQVQVVVNSKTLPISSSPYYLKVSTENGFTSTGTNTLQFNIIDSLGNKLVLAQGSEKISIITGQPTATTPPTQPTTNNTSNNTNSTSKKDDKFYNPLPTDSLIDMFLYIGKGFLALIGAWAVIAIIIGGFRMILAQGNEEAYGQAKKSIQWAVIGVVVALLSFSIIAIVQDLLSANVDTTPIQNVDPAKK